METRYPDWDVMKNRDHWDERTANLVQQRLAMSGDFKFFHKEEAKLLKAICEVVLADQHQDRINRVLAHIDQKLTEKISAGYRQVGLPEEQVLYRTGLLGVQETAHIQFHQKFEELRNEDQTKVMKAVADGNAQGLRWKKLSSKQFFKKLLRDTIEIYCSLPEIWSGMGYAGPAYPRGYVRIELGATDPWEAREPHD